MWIQRQKTKESNFPPDCMCGLINQMKFEKIINENEHYKLKRYLRFNAPDFLYRIMRPPNVDIDNFHWWKRGEWEPREKWIQEQINKLS